MSEETDQDLACAGIDIGEDSLCKRLNMPPAECVKFECKRCRNLESQLALAREGLRKIDGGFCEGNEPGNHGKCEEWMRDVARLTLAKLGKSK